MGEKHVFTFPGRYDEIKKICAFVIEGAEQAGLNESAVFHIELACDEACTNIIEHAYGGEDLGDIIVSWQIADDNFQITLQDNGRIFNPANVPNPASPTENESDSDEINYEELQIGGLGLHFMRNLMDDVVFEFDEESGNRLILTKQIPQE